MKAYVFVNAAAGKAADVLQQLRRIEGVKSADICWGLPDLVLQVEAADAKSLQDLVLNKIQKTGGVNQTDTHIVMES
jgi:translation elongation factor EF-1beta